MTKIDTGSFEALTLDSLPTFGRIRPAARREGTWTEDEVAKLKKLWAKGLSAGRCVEHLPGYTRNAIIGKVHRLGLAGLAGRSTAAKSKSERRTAPRTSKRPPAANVGAARAMRRAAAPTIPAEPIPIYREVEIPVGQRKRLVDLESRDCRWPIGDPQHEEFHFCARRQIDGSPYCEMHSQRAFQPERPVAKRPSFDMRVAGGKVIAR